MNKHDSLVFGVYVLCCQELLSSNKGRTSSNPKSFVLKVSDWKSVYDFCTKNVPFCSLCAILTHIMYSHDS